MLKVFSTDALWQIVNDTMQIYGGQGYFSNEPYERWMRDARINTIGEGANEVLKAFIAVVGLRGVGEHLKGVLDALRHPFANLGTLVRFGSKQVTRSPLYAERWTETGANTAVSSSFRDRQECGLSPADRGARARRASLDLR